MIKPILWSACLLAAMVAGPSGRAAESSPGGTPLRVQWETEPPRDGLQAVCGRVFNDGRMAAWHVLLLIEELDKTDQVTNSRPLEVLGEVPSEGNASFCLPEPAGASTYRMRVIGADWMSTPGQ